MQDNELDPFSALIAAYALGALDDEDIPALEEHLLSCAACREELDSYHSVVASMGLAAADATPSPALKARLLERVDQPAVPAAVAPAASSWQRFLDAMRNSLNGGRWLPAAAVMLLLLVGAVFVWQQAGSARTERFELSATDAAPGAQGLLEASEGTGQVTLIVTGLPVLPPTHQYQLWLIEDGSRTSGAVFSVSGDGSATVVVDSPQPLTGYGAFGVTIEPAGGSPGPTGQRVLGYNL